MCKKLLSLLLALCVAASLAVVPAVADTPDAGEVSTPTPSAGLSAPEGLGDGSAALQVTENGKDYVIGFTLGEGETRTIMRQSYDGYYWRDISGKPNPDNPSDKRLDAAVAVAEIVSDNSGEHYEFDSLSLSVNVLSMDLRYVSGDGSADDIPYSFSGDSDVTHLDAVEGNSTGIYLKQGYATDAQVVAKVKVSSNSGEVLETGYVALKLSGYHIYEDTVVCEAGASADDITAAIEAAVDEAPSREDSQTSGGTIHVVLEGDRYEGTIQIPADVMQTKGDYEIRFEPASASGRATIVGSVVCNDSQVSFYNMDFIAPEDQEESRAIYDGRSWAVNCTFRGYAVAMDDGEGDINGMGATQCVL